MMDWTDRHCRYFHRLLSPHARLYTEMVTTGAVLHGDRAHLLGFDPAERPLALQLGGHDPGELAAAARIGADLGYDEINLNVGCPSDRVQSGRFGACLMREPALVADGVVAMRAAVDIPVTVKCRIGVDDQDEYADLQRFTETMRSGVGDPDGACTQGVAAGIESKAESRNPAAGLFARIPPQARVCGHAHHHQWRHSRSVGRYAPICSMSMV